LYWDERVVVLHFDLVGRCMFDAWKCMNFSFCLFFLKNAFTNAWNVIFLRMHVKIHEICLNMNFWFYSFWKMNIRMHEIWFVAWCIYECIKFLLNMNFENACFNAWNLFKYEFLISMKMHVWMYEIWFFLFFLKNGYINAWNFVNFLNESACLNTLILFVFLILFFFFKKKECIYECIKLDFFCFIIFEEYIYECMKFDFLLFCYLWIMRIWMHEIWFYSVLLFLKNAYINAWNFTSFFLFIIFEKWIYECMKFNFFLLFLKNAYMNAWNFTSFFLFFYFLFWMKMHVWMLDILFFIFLDDNAYNEWNSIFQFLFSWMIMHEILFSWIIIFDANVCTNFFKWFYKSFFEWTFQR